MICFKQLEICWPAYYCVVRLSGDCWAGGGGESESTIESEPEIRYWKKNVFNGRENLKKYENNFVHKRTKNDG